MMLKLSQQELADRLGITCQQLQKYEKGTSRIAAGRLHMIAQALDASVGYFFAGLQGPETVAPPVAPAPDCVAGQVAPPAEANPLAALLLALRLPRAESGAPSAQYDALARILSGHSQWQAGKHKISA